MRENLRGFVIPAYVLLCLLLGGSAQGNWRNMTLQLLAVAIISWTALSRRTEPVTIISKTPMVFAAGIGLLLALHLIPLPPEIWRQLPGRDIVTSGFEALVAQVPWLAVSVAPYETLEAALSLLPPLAVLLGILRLGAYDEKWLTAAIIIGALMNVLLGTLQSVAGGWPDAWWYLYDLTNPGAVGFFANRNHTGTLLLVSIPFLLSLFSSQRAARKHQKHGVITLAASGLLLILVGLALNHSLAALVLVIPVVTASALLLPQRLRKPGLVIPILGVLAAVIGLATTIDSVRAELAGSDITSFEIRREIWTVTFRAIQDTFPVGTGIGSFRDFYSLYEEPTAVSGTFINHAHNDYLEIVLEGGVLGLLLVISFVTAWLWSVIAIWRSPLSNTCAKAATIGSGAILAHSFVDFPLRTAAIASIFAACVAVMVKATAPRSAAGLAQRDSPRHLVIS